MADLSEIRSSIDSFGGLSQLVEARWADLYGIQPGALEPYLATLDSARALIHSRTVEARNWLYPYDPQMSVSLRAILTNLFEGWRGVEIAVEGIVEFARRGGRPGPVPENVSGPAYDPLPDIAVAREKIISVIRALQLPLPSWTSNLPKEIVREAVKAAESAVPKVPTDLLQQLMDLLRDLGKSAPILGLGALFLGVYLLSEK